MNRMPGSGYVEDTRMPGWSNVHGRDARGYSGTFYTNSLLDKQSGRFLYFYAVTQYAGLFIIRQIAVLPK